MPVLLAKVVSDQPELAETVRRVDPDALARRFVADIDQHQQGILWGRNPLLFTLAAYVYAQSLAQGEAALPTLPASRVTLYNAAITALLAKAVRSRHELVSQEERTSTTCAR